MFARGHKIGEDPGSKTQLAPVYPTPILVRSHQLLSSIPIPPGVGGLGRNHVVRSGEEPRLTGNSPSFGPSCMVLRFNCLYRRTLRFAPK